MNLKSRKKKLILAAIFFTVVFVPFISIYGAYLYFSYDLPKISSLDDYSPNLVTGVYSRQGELIGELFTERRYRVPLSDVSPVMVEAIVSAEDDKFFQHKGINLFSIVRAAVKNIQSMEIKQGGSTITQQIVKSLLLTPEKSFKRKVKEAILSMRIERYLSKDDILTLYLNQIFFGQGAYGVEAAARVFFGKSAKDLNLEEASYLAGLPKAPSLYSPFKNLNLAKGRQWYVLGRMVEQGYIKEEEAINAANRPLNFIDMEDRTVSKAPYFVEQLRIELEREYGLSLYREGFRIETSLDINKQKAAEEAVERGIKAYRERNKIEEEEGESVQAALVAINPFTGMIEAMVGGGDFQDSQFNRVLQAKRQAGSALKPIVYAAALDKGFTPASIIIDSPVLFNMKDTDGYKFWEPQNYDRNFLGPVTMRQALTFSRNVVTIKILQDIGVEYVIEYAKKLGIEGSFNHDLTLALGTCGVSLLDLTRAYGVFCAGGIRTEPLMMLKISDRQGNVIKEGLPGLTTVISPQTAYLVTSMLRSVVEEGTGRRVRALKRPSAGKTGTTNEVRDALFIGFTPDIVTGVWVGFDDMRPLGKNETGAVAAAPVWLDFMHQAIKDTSPKEFEVPAKIVFVRINPETGYFPSDRNEETIFESFKEGTVPTRHMKSFIEIGD